MTSFEDVYSNFFLTVGGQDLKKKLLRVSLPLLWLLREYGTHVQNASVGHLSDALRGQREG